MSLFQSREKDGTIWAMVNGTLVKNPEVREKMLLFSVCYGRKKYMNCKVWASSEVLSVYSGLLERHDVVSVSGKLEQYTGKDGKQYWTIAADYVNAVQIPVAIAGNHESHEGGSLPGEISFADEEDDGELPF